MGGTTQLGGRIGALTLAAVALGCGGCVTPLAIGRDHVGLGLFRHTSPPEVAGVRTASTEGIGLLFRSGGVSIGYIDLEETVIDPEGSPEGVVVITPRISIATGRKAEAIASSEDAVSDFLDYHTSPSFWGVIP